MHRCRRPRSDVEVEGARPIDAAEPADAPAAWRVTDDELEALDALGKEGVWRVGGDELKLTNLDKPLFEPREARRRRPDHEARADPLLRAHRPDDAAATSRDRPLNLQRFPNGAGAPGFWQKDIPETAPKWLTRWHETGVDGRDGPRRQRPSPRRPRRGAVPGSATRRASRSTPGPASCPSRGGRRSPTSTSTPARRRPGTRPWSSPGCTGRRSGTSASAAIPRRPASAASRSGSRSSRSTSFADTSALGREGQSRASARPSRTSISWEWAKEARKGRARLDYTQNASIKTLVAPYSVRPAAGAPGLRADHLGRAGRPGPPPRPLDGPRRSSSASPTSRRPVRGRPDRRPGAAAGLSARRHVIRRDARVAGFARCLTT